VEACTTRLRLIVADQSKLNEPALAALGARGVLKPSAKAVQVVLGPIADAVAMEIRAAIGSAPAAVPVQPAAESHESVTLPPALISALGGADNIRSVTRLHGRLRVALVDASLGDLDAAGADFRAAVAVGGNVVHLLERP
jgi:PTS system N-acetylglucosamine-specific IIC component